MSGRETQPEVNGVSRTPRRAPPTLAAERVNYLGDYNEIDFIPRRPEMLNDGFDRDDRARLVRRMGEVSRGASSTFLDTINHISSHPDPRLVASRERIIESSQRQPYSHGTEMTPFSGTAVNPFPPEAERTRRGERGSPSRIQERASAQNRDGKYSPPHATPGPDNLVVEGRNTWNQKVDEVIRDLSQTKDVTLHRKHFFTPMHYFFV